MEAQSEKDGRHTPNKSKHMVGVVAKAPSSIENVQHQKPEIEIVYGAELVTK